jgi:hypothetical protein
MLPRPTLAVRKSHEVHPLAPLIKATTKNKTERKKKGKKGELSGILRRAGLLLLHL